MAKYANNVALLGGTFDPVHIGHLRIAIRLREVGFTQVWLIPNRIPPHRPQPVADAQARWAMLELACQGLDGIAPCSIELDREALSYSAVTVAALKEQYPTHHFTWVLGQDAWTGMEHWYRPAALLEQANVLVISRPGDHQHSQWQTHQLNERQCTLAELCHHPQGAICLEQWPELDISASSLRQALRQGDNIRFLTPDSVLEYIHQLQLYS